MRENGTIRVMIVDDSRFFTELIALAITTHPEIEVVSRVFDPRVAPNECAMKKPDVVLCDLEMPWMNGLELVDLLMAVRPVPIIMVTTVSTAVFDALHAGAVDFVAKPDTRSLQHIETFADELVDKIIGAARSDVSKRPFEAGFEKQVVTNLSPTHQLIAMGASTGGTEALKSVLERLPATVPGIVIAQHMPPIFSEMFASRLDKQTSLSVREATSGDMVQPGTVLIAPGDQHMRVKVANGRLMVECLSIDKVNGHRPSVDVLFDSVATHVGRRAIGVILTGMGSDGAKGLLAMRQRGARTIGQDERSSIVYGMPKAAHDMGAVEQQTSLHRVADAILAML